MGQLLRRQKHTSVSSAAVKREECVLPVCRFSGLDRRKPVSSLQKAEQGISPFACRPLSISQPCHPDRGADMQIKNMYTHYILIHVTSTFPS